MSQPFDLSKPNRVVHVGVILMGGMTEILDIAPVDLLYSMSQDINDFSDEFFPAELKKQAFNMEFHWVNETGKTAKLTAGARMQPTDTFATCPPLDIVLMGANDLHYEPNKKELEFIRKNYDDCSAFICICAGSLPALRAGLGKGKNVTGPREILDKLAQVFPDSKWEERRWQRDGKLWTSGSLLNGLDLMRAFAEQTYGSEGTLIGQALKIGAWPIRDVNYKDL